MKSYSKDNPAKYERAIEMAAKMYLNAYTSSIKELAEMYEENAYGACMAIGGIYGCGTLKVVRDAQALADKMLAAIQ